MEIKSTTAHFTTLRSPSLPRRSTAAAQGLALPPPATAVPELLLPAARTVTTASPTSRVSHLPRHQSGTCKSSRSPKLINMQGSPAAVYPLPSSPPATPPPSPSCPYLHCPTRRRNPLCPGAARCPDPKTLAAVSTRGSAPDAFLHCICQCQGKKSCTLSFLLQLMPVGASFPRSGSGMVVLRLASDVCYLSC